MYDDEDMDDYKEIRLKKKVKKDRQSKKLSLDTDQTLGEVSYFNDIESYVLAEQILRTLDT